MIILLAADAQDYARWQYHALASGVILLGADEPYGALLNSEPGLRRTSIRELPPSGAVLTIIRTDAWQLDERHLTAVRVLVSTHKATLIDPTGLLGHETSGADLTQRKLPNRGPTQANAPSVPARRNRPARARHDPYEDFR